MSSTTGGRRRAAPSRRSSPCARGQHLHHGRLHCRRRADHHPSVAGRGGRPAGALRMAARPRSGEFPRRDEPDDRHAQPRVHVRAARLRRARRPPAAQHAVARARSHARPARPLRLPGVRPRHHQPVDRRLGHDGRVARHAPPLHALEQDAHELGAVRTAEAVQFPGIRRGRPEHHTARGRAR